MIAALKESKGNFDAVMAISNTNRLDLQWWDDNIQTSCKHISKPKSAHVVSTDASMTGYRGHVFKGKQREANGSLRRLNII